MFDEGISFLIMEDPIDSYNDFSLKIYDSYDEVNSYLYINVVLESEPVSLPVPEPDLIPVPVPKLQPVLVDYEPLVAPIKPVVDTCAR